jgi:hypothetical protein
MFNATTEGITSFDKISDICWKLIPSNIDTKKIITTVITVTTVHTEMYTLDFGFLVYLPLSI